MEDGDLRYAAGFLDGEGYFSVRGNRVEIAADGIHPVPLLECRRILGGSIRDLGIRNKKCRRRFRWRVCGDKARAAARVLAPYLHAKRPEAEAVAWSKVHPAWTHIGGLLRRRALQNRRAEYHGFTEDRP